MQQMQPMMTMADPTAVVGKRVGAAIIDVVLMSIVGIVASLAFMDFQSFDTGGLMGCGYDYNGLCFELGDTVWISDGSGQGIVNLLNLVIGGAIFWWWQGTTGKTPGKVVVGIRTVNASGAPPGVLAAFLRSILWIVDSAPWCIPGLLGLITASSSKGHRRVGDMVASTYVIDQNAVGFPVPAGGGVPMAGATGWGTPMPAAPPPGAPMGGAFAPPPAAAPPQAPPQAAPAPASDPTQPQWDQARNAYIAWDATAQRWQQYDDPSGTWTPI